MHMCILPSSHPFIIFLLQNVTQGSHRATVPPFVSRIRHCVVNLHGGYHMYSACSVSQAHRHPSVHFIFSMTHVTHYMLFSFYRGVNWISARCSDLSVVLGNTGGQKPSGSIFFSQFPWERDLLHLMPALREQSCSHPSEKLFSRRCIWCLAI